MKWYLVPESFGRDNRKNANDEHLLLRLMAGTYKASLHYNSIQKHTKYKDLFIHQIDKH